MPAQSLASLPNERLVLVLNHPIHLEAIARVRGLLDLLRGATTWDEIDHLQRLLFVAIHESEAQRANCSRVLKRLSHAESIPKDAKPMRGPGSDILAETWEIEKLACERVARQYRSVGDAIAWTVSGFNRRYIFALSRNQASGPMVDKAGLPMELGTVDALWNEKHHFGLLHDLTNCLRIGDISEFTDDSGILIHEVKTSPGKKKKVQFARMEEAIRAGQGLGSLPGMAATLVPVSVPYKNEAKRLAALARLTLQRGVQGIPVPGGRAVVGIDLVVAPRLQPDPALVQRQWHKEFTRAQKRAGIANASGYLFLNVLDSAGQIPTLPPWGIFPMETVHATRLIADMMMFKAVVSLDAISEVLEAESLDPTWTLPPDGSEPQLSITRGNRRLTVDSMNVALQDMLVELIDMPTWAAALREILSKPDTPSAFVIVYENEQGAWAKPTRARSRRERRPTANR